MSVNSSVTAMPSVRAVRPVLFLEFLGARRDLRAFPTRRSSDLGSEGSGATQSTIQGGSMLSKLRRRAEDEEGSPLIELFVVIPRIPILAAIAIPTFLNQPAKAHDAAAKSNVRTAQTAESTYATD